MSALWSSMPDTVPHGTGFITTQQRAAVLVFGGHDPCGGAGIQADIEAIASAGAHAMCVLSMLSVQNSTGLKRWIPQPAAVMQAQAEAALAERPVHAIKVGVLTGTEQVRCVAAVCAQLVPVPLVLDPVLKPTTGTDFIHAAELAELLPLCTLLTPNRDELARLGADSETDRAARKLIDSGCHHVLLSSAESQAQELIHVLYTQATRTEFRSPRLPGYYHGSGCTLAARIAADLALALPLQQAIPEALDYVYNSLVHADAIDTGLHIPRRI